MTFLVFRGLDVSFDGSKISRFKTCAYIMQEKCNLHASVPVITIRRVIQSPVPVTTIRRVIRSPALEVLGTNLKVLQRP
jgi:hypothetical protein